VLSWDLAPLRHALQAGVLPVIYGDVVFDQELGATILSTEDLFRALAGPLSPSRILLAGLEAGVWMDFPARTRLVEQITPDSYHSVRPGVGQAMGADVTGGMQAKVEEMLELVQSVRGLEVCIFSAEEPRSLLESLQGGASGTRICL
jgi:isopentenyl phosphate kinase